MTDRVVLRKDEGSVTEIINAGASDMLVISQGSLQSINQLGDDLKLIIDSFEVYLRGGVSNGPEHL